MQKYKNAETLVWIVVLITILSFSLLWIINVLDYNKDITYEYWKETSKYIIEANAKNIVKKIDTSILNESWTFYIYKDKVNKEYKILTWSVNEEYKYVNALWEKVDKDTNLWKSYIWEFEKKIDILRHDIKPPEIPNMVFHFDANNIDWTDNSSYIEWSSIPRWEDLSWNNHDLYQNNSNDRPKLRLAKINKLAMVEFDWVNDILHLDSHKDINNDNICWTDLVYKEKSYAIVLKTWDDVTSQQVIFEQWWQATWYNFVVANWKIYAWIHNKATVPWYTCFYDSEQVRDPWHKFKSVELDEALPNSVYYIMIVQDSTNIDEYWNYIDSMNKLQIFLNWRLVMETDHVDPQPEHHLVWVWAVREWNVRPWPPYNTIEAWDGEWWCDDECLHFKWWIWEFISWNHPLSKNEVRWIQNYFIEKWLGWKKNIEYNIINTHVKEYNF